MEKNERNTEGADSVIFEGKEIEVGDKFMLHVPNSTPWNIEVININEYRPPDEKYAVDISTASQPIFETLFCGDDFFTQSNIYRKEY